MTDRSDHYRRLERMYLSAPTNEYYRPSITIGDGVAQISIEARPTFITPRMRCMARLLQAARRCRLLRRQLSRRRRSRPYRGFLIIFSGLSAGDNDGHGEDGSRGERIFVAQADLHDGGGNLIAHGVGSYVRSRIALP